MADFGGFNMPTPQELLAQQAAQRQKVMIGGNVQQQRSQNMESALDTLFGNPQMNLAKQLQSRVAKAEQSVQPVEGESDIDRELRRLSAVRDAVADVSPDVASQVSQQMLKLAQTKLEQRKLMGDIEHTENAEDRDAALHPGAIIEQMQKLGENYTESDVYMDRSTGQTKGVRRQDSAAVQALLDKGWIKIQLPSVQSPDFGGLGTTKPVTTDLQTTMLSTQNQLDALSTIGRTFDPNYLQLPEKLIQAGLAGAESLGVTLSPEQAARVQSFTNFRSNAIGAFNQYIKSITGAAMSQKEAERIQKAFINAEKDSPSQFIGKYRSTVKEILGVRKRAQQALQFGLKIQGDGWDPIPLPIVSDAEVDEFMGKQGLSPSGGTGGGSVVDRFRTP
jgi:hypothetical protein